MVYSSSDFEAFLLLYKVEGAPKNISIEKFCKVNGVNYEIFDKWLRTVHKKVIPVEIENAPIDFGNNDILQTQTNTPAQSGAKQQRIKFSIEFEDGMTISKQVSGINEIYTLLKKLEVAVC